MILGLVTVTLSPSLQTHLEKPMLSVFIPTTPNPTSGWYAIIAADDVINLPISIEDAFKVLISGGIVSPNIPNPVPQLSQTKKNNAMGTEQSVTQPPKHALVVEEDRSIS